MSTATPTAERQCPECGGRVVHQDDVHCEDCGLVISTSHIDRGPEWTEYSPEDKSKRRTGPSNTLTRHDRGIGTTYIGKKDSSTDTDGYGNIIPQQKQSRLARLRRFNRRSRFSSKKEKNLAQGFDEINRKVSALGLSNDIEEESSVLYRRVHSDGFLQGRSIESVTSACIYAVLRIKGAPYSVAEISSVSKVAQSRIKNRYNEINETYNLPAEPPHPTDYVPKIASEVEVPQGIESKVISCLENLEPAEYMGKKPLGVAAAGIYFISKDSGLEVTQHEISSSFDISEATIRQHQDIICP